MSHFINAITQHYADFSGRARRKEFWMFMLFGTVFLVVAMILDKVLRTTISMEIMDESIDTGHGWVYLLSCIGIILPSLAVGVRRLHDVGKSGWFLLVNLIPLAGSIWFWVVLCTDSQPGTNQYGPNPTGIGAATGS